MTSDLTLYLGDGLQALKDHGLLWALNAAYLHPRGYEARIAGTEFVLAGRGQQVIGYPEALWPEVELKRQAVTKALVDAAQRNNPAFWGESEVEVATLGAQR